MAKIRETCSQLWDNFMELETVDRSMTSKETEWIFKTPSSSYILSTSSSSCDVLCQVEQQDVLSGVQYSAAMYFQHSEELYISVLTTAYRKKATLVSNQVWEQH